MRVWRQVGWVTELIKPRRAPVPWERMLRTGIGVAVPVSVGYATGLLGPGIVCSIGALAASITDQSGPYRGRVARIGAVSLGGMLGFLVGGLVMGNPVAASVTVLVGGAVSGVVSVLGNIASVASLQFLIYLIVAANVSFGHGSAWMTPMFYLIGAAWALALSLVGGIGRRTAPERSAVAAVYLCLADLLEASGSDDVEPVRVRLTAALTAAYDAIVSFRAREAGRDPRVRALGALLNASTPVVEAAVSLARGGVPVPLPLIADTRAVASGIASGGRAALGRAVMLEHVKAESPALSQVERGLQAAAGILAGGRVETTGLPPRQRKLLSQRLKDAVLGGSVTWLPALRLVLCLAVAEFVGRFSPTERPYWIALTVAVTLKPDFGSVFARAVLRGTGTIVGVAIGGALLLVIPSIPVLLVIIGIFSAALPYAQRRNYGMFATFLTPVIVLLLDLGGTGDSQLVGSRLIDTAIGCAVVLVFGYLPWPGTWRSRTEFGARIADAADAVNAYLRIALGLGEGSRRGARRAAYRRLSDVRTLLQQALAEPPMVSRRAAAWWPAIIALERVADATTSFVVRHNPLASERGAGDRGGQPAGPGATQVLTTVPTDARAVTEFASAAADALRQNQNLRATDLPDLPETGPLAEIASELRTAVAVLAGPG